VAVLRKWRKHRQRRGGAQFMEQQRNQGGIAPALVIQQR
jgi:hypothetical protein